MPASGRPVTKFAVSAAQRNVGGGHGIRNDCTATSADELARVSKSD